MDALAALITHDFHTSSWTDQEIGWALGRGVSVLPIQIGVVPYGFAGKYQAISGKLDKPEKLAESLVQALVANSLTHDCIRRSLVKAFTDSWSFAMSKILRDIIISIKDFTDEEKESLRQACIDNYQISHAFGVPESISAAFGKITKPEPEPTEYEIPF